VLFWRLPDGSVQPEFVNKSILTDGYISTVTTLRLLILPSIATLVNPAFSLLKITVRILRTVFLVVLSNLPGLRQAVKKLSVANTGILYHDGRALATCESGPPTVLVNKSPANPALRLNAMFSEIFNLSCV